MHFEQPAWCNVYLERRPLLLRYVASPSVGIDRRPAVANIPERRFQQLGTPAHVPYAQKQQIVIFSRLRLRLIDKSVVYKTK